MTDKQIETLKKIAEKIDPNPMEFIEYVNTWQNAKFLDRYVRGFLTHPSTLKAVFGDSLVHINDGTPCCLKNDPVGFTKPAVKYHEHKISEIVENSAILDYYALNMPKEGKV